MTFPTPADNAWRPSSLLGREALLRLIGTRLLTERRIVIGTDPSLTSRTGVGRTRLVAELVSRIATPDCEVITLSGASPAAWMASLMQAARQLSLRQTTFRKSSDLIGALRSWLSGHRDWLLVADSLVDLDDIHELTDGIDSGRVIAVCNGPLPAVGHTLGWPAAVPLGTLSVDDALRVLGLAFGREWRDTHEVIAATQIITLLERNPLSCEWAGRTMWLAAMDPAEYLQSLKSPVDLTAGLAGLSLLLAAIEHHNPDALTLLSACVAWGPTRIPAASLQAIAAHLPRPTQATQLLPQCGLLRAIDDGARFTLSAREELLQLLPRESLQAGVTLIQLALPTRVVRNRLHELVCGESEIEVDPLAAPRISLGQLVAQAEPLSRDQAALVQQAADAALDLLLPAVAQQLLLKRLAQAVKAAQRDESLLLPLVELGTAYVMGEQFQLARRRWRQAVEFCPAEHPMLAELLLAIAEIDVNENRLDRAGGRLIRVGEIGRSLPITPHHQLLKGQRKYLTAGAALGQGDVETARELFRVALELRSPLLPADHPHLMRNRLMLARTEFLRKDYAASERILIDEIEIRESSSKVSETEVGVAYNFLGEQYYLSGRLSDAEPIYERALELRRSTLPRGNRLIGEMSNRLAVIKSARGAYKESDALFRESLSNLEETYGADHPEVARVLNDLAESLFSQSKVEPARRLLERALGIQEKSLRRNDVRVGRTRCNLAAVYVARGRFGEAIRLYEKDVTERQSQKNPDKASLATSLNNLAEALRSLGQLAEAEERLKQSLVIREEMVGPAHPQVAQILNNLGYLHLQQHRFDEARVSLERALQIREASLSPQHPHLATTLGTLAEVYFTQGNHTAARPLYTRAIEIFLAAHGERHPHTASLQICSARNELRLGHVGRAELMLLRGKTTIEEVLGADHRTSAKVLLGIAELAHAEKRYEPAFPMLERCLAIQYGTMSSQRLEIAETLRLISENLVARGLAADALPRIVEAVDIQRAVLGPQHCEVIPNMLLIGVIQQQVGQAAAAEEALRFVLEHADPLTQSNLIHDARERLPDVLVEGQKYDEAAALLAAKIAPLEASGPTPQLVSTLSQLAGIHYLRSAPDAAAPLMERCVELSEQLHGHDAPETAKHLDNLAGVRFLLGQYDSAEPAIQRSIRILEHEIPVRPAALTKARENYIQLLRQTNRLDEADQLASLLSPPPVTAEPAFFSGGHVLDDL